MPEAAVPATLRAQQDALAAHLRDPAGAPAPVGLDERRLAVYRALLFNNIAGLLAANVPVLKSLLAPAEWRALVRAFYAGHRARTPLFPRLGAEFAGWLEARAAAGEPGQPGWMHELAHYETVEAELRLADPDPTDALADPDGDLLAGAPMPASLARVLAYAWPVHRLAAGRVPDAPPAAPTVLLAHRDAAGKVRFAESTVLVFRLFQRLEAAPALDGLAQLRALAEEAGAPDREAFVADGLALLLRLRALGVLLGTRPRSA